MGRTPLESARAYASMPPDEAETEGAWVWQLDAVAGGAGADWATCLRLLERRRRHRQRRSQRCGVDGGVVDECGGGCLFVPGGKLNEIKKSKKTSCFIWLPAGKSNATTNQKHMHVTQEVNVSRFDR